MVVVFCVFIVLRASFCFFREIYQISAIYTPKKNFASSLILSPNRITTSVRLNILTLIAAAATGNSWSYYYFTPLASLWTVVVRWFYRRRFAQFSSRGTRSSHVITRHTSHATRHTPHATRHTPHATRHTPHVTRQQVMLPLMLLRPHTASLLLFSVRAPAPHFKTISSSNDLFKQILLFCCCCFPQIITWADGLVGR